MKKSEVAVIKLQLDTEEVKIRAGEVSKVFADIQKIVSDTCIKISDNFNSVLYIVKSFKDSVEGLSDSVKSMTEWDFSSVLTGLDKISTTLDNLLKKLQETDWLSIVSLALGIFSQGFEIFAYETTRSKGKYESGKTTLGGGNGKYTPNKNSEQIGILGSGAMNASGVGTLDGSLAEEISSLIALLTSSTAAWAKNTAAKIADKAEDLAIISLYAVDYVKAFGTTIAQLASSTGAWIANTAAKVGNTAAQWAQIAAVTAWQALCTVATAVTTALGRQ